MRVGSEAAIGVAVATLWSTPEAVRPIDFRALGRAADISAWVAGMSAEQQVGDAVLSQLLLGERLLVDEVRPDGWARVVALEQPAATKDSRGYPGWLPLEQLAAVGPRGSGGSRGAQALVVDAAVTDLRSEPAGPVALAGVMVGTRLTVADSGPAVAGTPATPRWWPVHVPGHAEALFASADHVVPADARPADAGTALAALDVARRFRDVSYVWGGVSSHGIDCSGLVHLAWRRLGVTLPRDAADQADATMELTPGQERPGDLYFFARPGRRIHHIGIVTNEPGAPRRMLHACYTKRRVLEEAMPPDRAATLVGVHRVRTPAAP